jgi:hypothetical protein
MFPGVWYSPRLAVSINHVLRKEGRRTDNIGRVGTVAGEDRVVGAGSGGTSNLGGSLPDNLGKVTSSGRVAWQGKVVQSYS